MWIFTLFLLMNCVKVEELSMFNLEERNRLNKNRKEIIWKERNKVKIELYAVLFGLREICEK